MCLHWPSWGHGISQGLAFEWWMVPGNDDVRLELRRVLPKEHRLIEIAGDVRLTEDQQHWRSRRIEWRHMAARATIGFLLQGQVHKDKISQQ